MMKLFFSLVCLFLSQSVTSSSSTIECKYEMQIYFRIGGLYQCNVVAALSITTPESAQISTITGAHSSSKTNDDVYAFQIYENTVELFPRGLEKFFKNIIAITLGSCKIKEIYQTDLKPFPGLVYLCIDLSDIEVLEEGLFAFNPRLRIFTFVGRKVIHIDPTIFDHLTKLEYVVFIQFYCAGISNIAGNGNDVKAAIMTVKSRCINSEYSKLDVKIKFLESEAKSLNSEEFSSEEFNKKLENLEKTFKNSKFFKFRPLKGRFESLMKASTLKPNQDIEKCPATINSENFSVDILKNITTDIKLSQCGLKDDFSDLKNQIRMCQSTTSTSLSDITSKINDIKSSNFQILNSQNAALNDLKLTQNDLKDVCSTSQTTIIDSLSNLTKNINSSQEDTKILQFEIKESVSDMESSLSGLKTFQNDVKVALIKLKTTQNEIKISIDEIKVGKSENSEGNVTDFKEILGNLEGKLEIVEVQIADLAGNIDKNQKEMTNKLHKMSTNLDEKIKGIENRLMKKFDEILEDKLRKILAEKLSHV